MGEKNGHHSSRFHELSAGSLGLDWNSFKTTELTLQNLKLQGSMWKISESMEAKI
jgi:hypothetical protein